MRLNGIWIIVIIATALIQATWLDTIRFGGVVPDLILLLVVYVAIAFGEERAMWTGVMGGLFQDVARSTSIGQNVLCHVIVAYAAGRIANRLVTESPAVKTGLVFCAAIAHGLMQSALVYIAQPHLANLGDIVARIVPSGFYTALVTPVVFYVFDRIFRSELEPLQSRTA
jgi:rod shape-determining protein MreD